MLNTNMTRTVIIIVWRCNDDYYDEYSAMHAIYFSLSQRTSIRLIEKQEKSKYKHLLTLYRGERRQKKT